jgi:hypothetical protein
MDYARGPAAGSISRAVQEIFENGSARCLLLRDPVALANFDGAVVDGGEHVGGSRVTITSSTVGRLRSAMPVASAYLLNIALISGVIGNELPPNQHQCWRQP